MADPTFDYGSLETAPAAPPPPFDYGSLEAEQPSTLPGGRTRGLLGTLDEMLGVSSKIAEFKANPVKALGTHLLETYKQMGLGVLASLPGQLAMFQQAKQEENPAVKAGYAAAGAIPIVGPMAASAGERLGGKDWTGGALATALALASSKMVSDPAVKAQARIRAAVEARRIATENRLADAAAKVQLERALTQEPVVPELGPPLERPTVYQGPAVRTPPPSARVASPPEPTTFPEEQPFAPPAEQPHQGYAGRTTAAGLPDKRTTRRTEPIQGEPSTATGQLTPQGFASLGDEEASFPGRREPNPATGARDVLPPGETGALPSSGADMGPDYVRSVLNVARKAIPAERRRPGINVVENQGRTYVVAADAEGNIVAAGIGDHATGNITDMAKATRLFSEAERAGIDMGQRAEATRLAEEVRAKLHELGFESTPEARSPDAARAEARYLARQKGQGFGQPVENFEPSPRGNAPPGGGGPQRPPGLDEPQLPKMTPAEQASLDERLAGPGRPVHLPGGPAEGEVPPLREGWRGVVERNVRSAAGAIRRVPGIGQKLDTVRQAYLADEEAIASPALADLMQAKRSLRDKSLRPEVLRVLEGEASSNPQVTAAAAQVRKVLDRLYSMADTEGIAARFEEDYLPHYFDNKEFGRPITPGVSRKSASGVVPVIERERAANAAGYRLNWDILEKYVVDASRRISQARHFGPNMEEVRAMGEGVGLKGGLAEWVTTAFNRIAQVEPRTAGERLTQRISGTVRQVQALADLGLSALPQFANQAFVMTEVGFPRYARAVAGIARDVLSYEGRTELLDHAIRSGALFPNVSHEVSTALSGTRGFLWGVPTADKAGRIIAQRVGEEMAKYNNGRPVSPAEVLRMGKMLSDKTQFRVDVSRMPLWASSPVGRVLTQYASFMAEYGKYVGHMMRAGEWGKLAQLFGIIAPLVGEGVADGKEFLRGRSLWGDDDPKEWEAILRGRRIAPNTPRGAVMRALQNVAGVGGAGLFQTFAERLIDMRAHPLAWMGRIASTAQEGGEAVSGVLGGDLKPAARFATRNSPAGGTWGPQYNREFLPTKTQQELGPEPHPGWIGKIRDVISPLDETGALRSEERKKTAALIEARRIEKEQFEQTKGLRPERPTTTAETKIGKSKRNATRLGLEREIRQAIAAGQPHVARRLALQAKLREHINFPVEEWIRGYEPPSPEED